VIIVLCLRSQLFGKSARAGAVGAGQVTGDPVFQEVIDELISVAVAALG
jgi:hypothetical protein